MRNLESAKAAYVPPPKLGETRPCAHCGKDFYLTRTMIKRKAKTCSRVCWRAWLAARFDRAIAHVEELENVSGYDEFLSGARLHCLVAGCEWFGHNLALHMNQSHGKCVEEVKAIAGFNKGTALVSATMARNLSLRNNGGSIESIAVAREHSRRSGCKQEVRQEAIEHMEKAAALRSIASTPK